MSAEPRVMAKAAYAHSFRRAGTGASNQHRPEELGPRELHAEVVGEGEAGGRLALHAANPDAIY